MKEARKFQRVDFRKRVFFGLRSYDYVGFSEDISLTGIHLATSSPFPAGTKLIAGFGTKKEDIKIKVKGTVKWVRRAKEGDLEQELDHLGLKLSWHGENYMQFLADLIEEKRLAQVMEPERREDIRFEERVTVIFDDEEEVMEQYTQNISRGGLFVATDRPLQKGAELTLRIVLPQVMEDVQITGKVAFVVDLAAAQKHNRPPGMGVKFEKFADGDYDKFVRYLEKIHNEVKDKGC